LKPRLSKYHANWIWFYRSCALFLSANPEVKIVLRQRICFTLLDLKLWRALPMSFLPFSLPNWSQETGNFVTPPIPTSDRVTFASGGQDFVPEGSGKKQDELPELRDNIDIRPLDPERVI